MYILVPTYNVHRKTSFSLGGFCHLSSQNCLQKILYNTAQRITKVCKKHHEINDGQAGSKTRKMNEYVFKMV